MSSQKAILLNESVNKTRGPQGLNSINLSTINPTNYSGRYSYGLSLQPSFKNNEVFINSTAGTVVDNKAKVIHIREAEKALRQLQFDYYNFEFNSGYPTNFSYGFCTENLSLVHNYHSYFYSRKYNPILSYSAIDGNNFMSCGCNTIACPPLQTFDPISCQCVSPPICVPQDTEVCTAIELPPNLKTIAQGYAIYTESLTTLNIPGLDPIQTSCAGGHGCNTTLFRPILKKTNNAIIEANKAVCMDNGGGVNDGIQVTPLWFVSSSNFDRADSFTIEVDNASDWINSSIGLECEYDTCHDGITFIVLVGEDSITNDKVLLFASCLFPGQTNAKVIGTIDCVTVPGELCSPQPPSPPTNNCDNCNIVWENGTEIEDWTISVQSGVMDSSDPYSIPFGIYEWQGMGGDENMYWNLSTVNNYNNKTIFAQIASYNGIEGIENFVKLWGCSNSNIFSDITLDIAYASEYSNGWLYHGSGANISGVPPVDNLSCS